MIFSLEAAKTRRNVFRITSRIDNAEINHRDTYPMGNSVFSVPLWLEIFEVPVQKLFLTRSSRV